MRGAARPWNRVPLCGDACGRFVEVTPEGNVGRMFRDLDWKREYATLAGEAGDAAGTPVPWRTRMFIVRAIDAEWREKDGAPMRRSKVRFTDEQVEAFRRVADAFADHVRVYSGGRARLDATVKVLDEPLTRLDGSGDMVHPWMDAVAPVIFAHARPEDVDSVMLFWPAGDIPHKNVWGLTGYPAFDGAGYSWVTYLGGAIDERVYAEVAFHEWLHQLEFTRGAMLGYPGLPTLHDGERCGYVADAGHPGWMTWYRDFSTTYMTPAMWSKHVPRRPPAGSRPSFEGGFVREWLVAGPYPNAGGAGLDVRRFDEASSLPEAGEAAGNRRWQRVETGRDVLDLAAGLSPRERVTAYAHVYVRSPRARTARLFLGSDDGVRVAFNGREVWRHRVDRGTRPDQDSLLLSLKAGWNRLLFAVDQGGGAWGLCARLTRADGGPIPDLTFRARRPTEDAEIVREDEAPVPPSEAWKLRFYDWDAVKDDPWAKLPELTEARLRDVTGDPGLRLETGEAFTALVATAPVRTPGVDARLDFGRESLAWLRHRRGGIDRDLLLVRPDVADLWLHDLDALDDPSVTVLGRVTAGNRPLIAVETRLPFSRERPPRSELGLLRAQDAGLAVNLIPEESAVALGEEVRCRVLVVNRTQAPADVPPLSIRRRAGAKDGEVAWGAGEGLRLEAGETRAFEVRIPLDRAAERPGPYPLSLEAGSLCDVAVVAALEPVVLSVLDASTGAPLRGARTGAPLRVVARVRNNLSRPLRARVTLAAPAGWATAGATEAEVAVPPRAEGNASWTIAVPREVAAGVHRLRIGVETVAPAGAADALSHETALRASPWLIVGPFDHAERKGFATAYPPETVPFDRAAVFDGKGGKVAWSDLVPAEARCDAGGADFAQILVPAEWGVAYATADLESPDDRAATLSFGSDDTLTVWVNGEKVLARDVYRPAVPGQDSVEVRLKKGRNRLLVKVCQGVGGWEFFLGIPKDLALRAP